MRSILTRLVTITWALSWLWCCAGNVRVSSDPVAMAGQPSGDGAGQSHPESATDPGDSSGTSAEGDPGNPGTHPSGSDPSPDDPAAGDPSGQGPQAFPSVNGQFAQTGPFAIRCASGGPSNGYTLCHPQDLGAGGRKHPILTWGNGSFVTSQSYDGLLKHFASHGFYVIATNSTSSGRGTEMLAGITWLASENQNPSSPLYAKLDPEAVAALGHSEGGGGTIAAGNDARVKCTLPIEPWMAITPSSSSGLKGPTFIIAGSADLRVSASAVKTKIYDPAQVPAVFGILQGGDHYTPGGDGGPDIRFAATAWLRLYLMGDESARGLFYGGACTLCKDPNWQIERKNQ